MSNTSRIRTLPTPGAFPRADIRQLPGLLHGRDDIHGHVEALLDPFALLLSLFLCALLFDPRWGSQYLVLGLVLVMLTYPGRSRLHVSRSRLALDVVFLSITLIGLLSLFGWSCGYLALFPANALIHWLWLAPVCLIATHLAFRMAAPLVLTRAQRCVIVGMNDQGKALANRIIHNPYADLAFDGFFDDRNTARTANPDDLPLLGRIADVARYASANHVHVIYISLPMATQERTMNLLDALRDTTASIYFVPDQFVTELIQSRASFIVDIPVVAVCETPFVGVNGLMKRLSDIVVSAIALVLLSPVLLIIATLVKFGSSGPAIFTQRRYGLDGEEINVYKFRSMRVEEDGHVVRQAKRNDSRITAIGAFLRKTSLDELPQLINVLQGRMSLVGPRPHAVAHNELYRKLIKGYMVRHKVRPGITGWAQVNGLRGETDTVDKMAARIQYDLDYLRHWSLRLDLHILIRTLLVVVHDKQAY